MKQTPLQKAIEWLDKDPKGMLHAYDKQIMTEYLHSLLPYERKCIEGAYDAGRNNVLSSDWAAPIGDTKPLQTAHD